MKEKDKMGDAETARDYCSIDRIVFTSRFAAVELSIGNPFGIFTNFVIDFYFIR